MKKKCLFLGKRQTFLGQDPCQYRERLLGARFADVENTSKGLKVLPGLFETSFAMIRAVY